MPNPVTIDFTGTSPATAMKFAVLPPGWYWMRVATSKNEPSKSGKPMISVTLTVARGPEMGATIGDNFALPAAAGDSDFGKRRLMQFLQSLGLQVEAKRLKFDLDGLVGMEVLCFVGDDEYNGRPTSKPQAYDMTAKAGKLGLDLSDSYATGPTEEEEEQELEAVNAAASKVQELF